MSDVIDSRPTTFFYILGGVFLVWNLIGLAFYYQQMTLTTDIMVSQGLSDAQIAWIQSTPVWANAAYAIAVTSGLIASLLLLLRKALAIPAYLLSFLGVMVQDIETFLLRSPGDVWGSGAYVLPSIVVLIAIVEIAYSRTSKRKGWLS